MSSSIKLKNQANTEFSITHADGIPAKTVSSKDITVAVDTVTAMQAINTAVQARAFIGANS